MGRQRLGV